MNNKIKYIYKKSDLISVIKFLKNGYNWSVKRSNEIKKHFKGQKGNVPMGAYRKENGKFKIAILLFNQSNYFSKQENIISLCSMYATKSHRGIPVINFVRKLTEDLHNFTITNYSPNEIAYKIWKSVGWKNMRVKKIQLGFAKKFPFFKLRNIKNLFDYTLGKKIHYNYIETKNKKTKIKNELKVHFLLRNLRVKKKFFKLNIIDYYIDINKTGKIPFWSLLFHVFKNKGVQINLFINDNNKINQLNWQSNKLNWLVKNSKNSNGYVLPLGSEKCIKTGVEKI
ncbi:hypothetical protein N9O39_04310 [Candidatus Pelagibacter sp.]|nr:hypothetical protein [Candidatus Pelagibacter sp.]